MAGASLGLRICALALAFIGSILSARLLGPSEYGIYSYVMALIVVLGIPAQAGIPILLVRETSSLHAREEWGKIKGVWWWTARAVISLSMVTGGVLVAACQIVGNMGDLDGFWVPTLLLGAFLIPLSALGNARAAALRGLHFNLLGQMPEYIVRPAVFAVMMLFFWGAGRDMTPPLVMSLQVGAAAVAFMAGVVLLMRLRPQEVALSQRDVSGKHEWKKALFPLALTSALGTLASQIGVLVAGFLTDEEATGIYKVAISASTLSLIGVQAVALVSSPRIASSFAVRDLAALENVASAASLASLALVLPFFIVFVFYGEEALYVLYGASYVSASGSLILLTAGNFVASFFASSNIVMIMTRNEAVSAKCLLMSTALNIVLCFLLVPIMGINGIAAAAAFSNLLGAGALWWIGIRKVGVDSSPLVLLKRRGGRDGR